MVLEKFTNESTGKVGFYLKKNQMKERKVWPEMKEIRGVIRKLNGLIKKTTGKKGQIASGCFLHQANALPRLSQWAELGFSWDFGSWDWKDITRILGSQAWSLID